jgi:hypothetical protein
MRPRESSVFCGPSTAVVALDLLAITYWHEYLDIMFFFKAVTNIITVSNEVLPQPIIPSRLTRTSVDTNMLSFRPRKCKTLTYQRSFFIWGRLFKSRLTLTQD